MCETNFTRMLDRYGSYRTYLRSKHWRRVKEERVLLDGGACVACGSTHNLQCHHLSYENIGTDGELDDIITLCEECHKKAHVRRFDEP